MRCVGRFLQCREQWLAEVVSELDDASIYEYLKRLTDVHRLQLFDVVMQFRAIFSDEAAPQYPPAQAWRQLSAGPRDRWRRGVQLGPSTACESLRHPPSSAGTWIRNAQRWWYNSCQILKILFL